MAKAKREGIRMAKFPIEKYLDWGFSSSKSLTLDQTLRIMLDLRHTKDWKEALKNVPSRKLRPARENILRSKMQGFISEIRKPEEQKSVFRSFDRSETQKLKMQRSTSFDESEIQEPKVQRSISFDNSETQESKMQKSFDRSKTREPKMPLNFTFQKRKVN